MNAAEFHREFGLLVITGILSALVFGTAALWAVCGRTKWVWRVTPLVLLLAALVPIGAYEPLALFSAQTAVVVAGLLIARRVQAFRIRHSNRNEGDAASSAPVRFALHDVLTGVLLTGVVLAIVRFASPSSAAISGTAIEWWAWVVDGVELGLLFLTATWLVFGTARWYLRLLLAAIVTAAVSAHWEVSQSSFVSGFLTPVGLQVPDAYCAMSVILLALVAILWLAILRAGWPFRARASQSEAARTHWGRWLVRALACAILASATWMLATVYLALLPRGAPASPPQPSANGYDQLLAAGRKLNWSAIPSQDYDLAGLAACQVFTATNQGLLDDVRQAFLLPSNVPITYDIVMNNNTTVPIFRSLARALRIESMVQSAAGNVEQAAERNLDQLRLSRSMSHNGLLIDYLVAYAIEGLGTYAMVEDWQNLDGTTLELVTQELLKLDANREPIEDVVARDEYWWGASAGWQGRLWLWIEKTVMGGSPAAHYGPKVQNRNSAFVRLVAVEATVRRHILATGSPPESLEALVPTWLPRVPLDPYSGLPLKYRRTADGYLLYSVGANRVDDGGERATFVDATVGNRGDLFFDTNPDND